MPRTAPSVRTDSSEPALPRRLTLEQLEARCLMTAALAGSEFSGQLTHGGVCHCPICSGQGLQELIEASSFTFADTTGSSSGPVAAGTPGSIPQLASLPGASVTLFLDFDGNTESSWGGYSNVVTRVFDRDGDATTFSASEISTIEQIWARVAEDYAPFNINVTTVAPPTIANGVSVRIAIGGNWSDWFGQQAGGVAYVGGFYNSASNVGYVFEEALGNGDPRYTAEAASHEAGHLFGLWHQASWSGSTLVQEYNRGNDAWAPIMGVGYYSQRTTWHNGPTDEAPNDYQDDMAWLGGSTNGFGYRADDYGSTTATATLLATSGSSVNLAGLIGRNDDKDLFRFTTSGGSVSFSLAVAQYGANLDGVLDLLNADGQIIASANPSNSLGASLSATLTGGTYYVSVHSSGGYGNVGKYTLTGTVPGVTESPQIGVSVGGTAVADGGTLSFGSTTVGSAVLRTVSVTNVGSGTLQLTSLANAVLPSGFTLVSDLGSTALAAGQSTTFTLRFEAGETGSFGGSLAIASSDEANGSFDLTLAGTVTTAPPPAPLVRIIDNGATGFTTKGSWIRQSNLGREKDIHYANKGNGSAVATWTFGSLPAGTYRVSVTWPKGTTYATNAPFTVLDNTASRGTFHVSQRVSSSGLTADGSNWTTLGTFTINSGKLVVTLSNSANGRVVADAVRIERIFTTSSTASLSSQAGGDTGGLIALATSRDVVAAPSFSHNPATPSATVAPAANFPFQPQNLDAVFSRPGDLEPELDALRQASDLLDDLASLLPGSGNAELRSAIDELLSQGW